jgi:threonine/homoserine/homoserine lactone efflux protein
VELHTYLLFIGAVVVLCAVPGPDLAYLLARTITQGRRAGLVAAIGINVGAYVHVFAAVLGLSAILATSSTVFTVLKWIGACYLVWIGVRALMTRSAPMTVSDTHKPAVNVRRIFWEGFLCDALNPKVAIFFLAFLPQFVTKDSEIGTTTQLLLLGVTCNVVAIGFNFMLVFCASAATSALRKRSAWLTWLNRAAGALFIGLGIRLVRERL